jgi:hypothetical protein
MCGATQIFMLWCLMKHRDNFTFSLSPYHTFSTCQYTEATERIPMNGEDGDQEASSPCLLCSPLTLSGPTQSDQSVCC